MAPAKALNPRRIKIRLLYLAASLLAVLLFNLIYFPSPKSALQGEFEGWIGKVIHDLRITGDGHPAYPAVTLRLKQPTGDEPLSIVVDATSKPERAAQMARLLEVAREASLFTESIAIPENANAEAPGILPEGFIEIVAGTHRFASPLSEDSLDANPAAQNLVRLLKIYGADR